MVSRDVKIVTPLIIENTFRTPRAFIQLQVRFSAVRIAQFPRDLLIAEGSHDGRKTIDSRR